LELAKFIERTRTGKKLPNTYRLLRCVMSQNVSSQAQVMYQNVPSDVPNWYMVMYQNGTSTLKNKEKEEKKEEIVRAPMSERTLRPSPPPTQEMIPPTQLVALPRSDKSDPLRGFSEWWSHYPKKKARGDAERAWQKIHPDQTLCAVMIAKVDEQKASHDWMKDDGQYIPMPATWLNGKRWLDEGVTVATDQAFDLRTYGKLPS
jgi:hypothetical protein